MAAPVTSITPPKLVIISSIDMWTSNTEHPVWNRSVSSTYKNPTSTNNYFDIADIKELPKHLVCRHSYTTELRIDHKAGPHAFPCRIPCE